MGGKEGGGGQRGAWKEDDGVGGGDDPCLGGDFCNCTGELSEEGNLLKGIDNCSELFAQQVLSSRNFYLFRLGKKTNFYKKFRK